MKRVLLLGCILLLSIFQLHAQKGDLPGSKDHEIISRYPGSEIRFYYQLDYNEIEIPTAVKDALPAEILTVKGKHTSILYRVPEGVTPLQVIRNYEEAITSANGEILFKCEGKFAPGGCDDYNEYYELRFLTNNYRKRQTETDQYTYVQGSDNQAFLTAVFEEADKRTYVEIGVNGTFLDHPVSINIEIVEEKIMTTGLVSAKKIEDELHKNGKIALYGILFDTGQSTLKPESEKELGAIYDYLKANSAVKLYIVGHTDDTGTLDRNQQLSADRAKAVVSYLTKKGINHERLLGKGVGPLAPVANNTTDAGKKRNRRVELVLRLN